MGRQGYALMIDHGIETARGFADQIRQRELFDVVTEPELNILTYRILPPPLKKRLASAGYGEKAEINRELNQINTVIQRKQREAGKSFVSRTSLRTNPDEDQMAVVFRSVLMNPMTDLAVLEKILDEQEALYQEHFCS